MSHLNQRLSPFARCAVYARTAAGGAEREACERFIARELSAMSARLHYQDVASGADTGRCGLRHMLSDGRRGRFECLVVASADRLSRTVADVEAILDELDAAHVAVIAIDEWRKSKETLSGPKHRALIEGLRVQVEAEKLARSRPGDAL